MSYKNKTKKEYMKEYRQKAKFNRNSWYTKTYGRMKRDNKAKFNENLPFSKDEFVKWIEDQNELFNELFKEYVNSNFNKYKNPSIDRINDYKGYDFDNMQLLSWEENNRKGRSCSKNKNQCSEMAKEYWSKRVYMYNECFNLIREFNSTRDAARTLEYDNTGIARACRTHLKYKGYYWRYEKI